MTRTHPFDIGEPRVSPGELKSGVIYDTPMGAIGRVLILSVGPKWITEDLRGSPRL